MANYWIWPRDCESRGLYRQVDFVAPSECEDGIAKVVLHSPCTDHPDATMTVERDSCELLTFETIKQMFDHSEWERV